MVSRDLLYNQPCHCCKPCDPPDSGWWWSGADDVMVANRQRERDGRGRINGSLQGRMSHSSFNYLPSPKGSSVS